VSVLQEI